MVGQHRRPQCCWTSCDRCRERRPQGDPHQSCGVSRRKKSKTKKSLVPRMHCWLVFFFFFFKENLGVPHRPVQPTRLPSPSLPPTHSKSLGLKYYLQNKLRLLISGRPLALASLLLWSQLPAGIWFLKLSLV